MSPANKRIKAPETGRKGGHETGRASQAEQAAGVQSLREKSALEGQIRLQTEIARLGASDEDEQAVLDSVEADLLEVESEISMEDEDSLQDQNLTDLDAFQGELISWEGADGENDLSFETKFRLLVSDELCQLHIPSWFAFPKGSEAKNEVLDETSNRLDTLERVAAYLSEFRKDFLRSADPWDLGCDALTELEKGTPSVTEDGFIELARIKGSQFTRHRRECVLVWEDGHMPLDILFGMEAKLAWAANAFCQRCDALEEQVTGETLDDLANLTMPKKATKKRNILGTPLNGLGFSEMVIRICLLAGVAWKDVLDHYRGKILKEFDTYEY